MIDSQRTRWLWEDCAAPAAGTYLLIALRTERRAPRVHGVPRYLTGLILASAMVPLGLYFSTLFHRTGGAAVAALMVMGALVAATFLIGALSRSSWGRDDVFTHMVMGYNPFYGLRLVRESVREQPLYVWLLHYGEMLALAAITLAAALARVQRIRE